MYQEFFNNRVPIAAVDASWDKFVFKIKAYKYTLPRRFRARGHLCFQGRYFHIKRSGGGGSLYLTSKFGGKIWARSGQVHQIRGKSLGSSVTTRRKSWEKIPILESNLKFSGQNLGYLSPIFVEAKFGAPTRISETKRLRPPNMEVPPWGYA